MGVNSALIAARKFTARPLIGFRARPESAHIKVNRREWRLHVHLACAAMRKASVKEYIC